MCIPYRQCRLSPQQALETSSGSVPLRLGKPVCVGAPCGGGPTRGIFNPQGLRTLEGSRQTQSGRLRRSSEAAATHRELREHEVGLASGTP